MKTHKEINVPKKIQVGGQDIDVEISQYLPQGDLGDCNVAEGTIKISDTAPNTDTIQSTSSMQNTFYHELTHAILTTMGRFDLNDDEVFVSTFGSFLCEAMKSAGVKFDIEVEKQ